MSMDLPAEDGFFSIPNIVFDVSTLSTHAFCLYIYLCSLADKRGTRVLTGNVLEDYMNRYVEGVRPHYSPDLCFDALYELTFPRPELGGKSYVSIELPTLLTAEEDEEDALQPGRTRRIIHLNDVTAANARAVEWLDHLARG